VKKFLILAGASLLFAACAESPTSPTSGRRITPSGSNHDDDFKCASGYVVAFDENGNPYCAPEEDQARPVNGGGTTARGGTTTTGRP
jgi:hypothetical protein